MLTGCIRCHGPLVYRGLNDLVGLCPICDREYLDLLDFPEKVCQDIPDIQLGKNSMYDKVKEFHNKFDSVLVPDRPSIPNQQVLRNIWNKTCEELGELEDEITHIRQNAGSCMTQEEEREVISRVAKEIGDSIYMLLGVASFFGLPMDEVFDEVHKSNMSKSVNDQGRIVKEGLDYKPADIEKVIYGSEPTVSENYSSDMGTKWFVPKVDDILAAKF